MKNIYLTDMWPILLFSVTRPWGLGKFMSRAIVKSSSDIYIYSYKYIKCICLVDHRLQDFLVGVSNVTPGDQERMEVDEWNMLLCKKHEDRIEASANETLLCYEAVRGGTWPYNFTLKLSILRSVGSTCKHVSIWSDVISRSCSVKTRKTCRLSISMKFEPWFK